MKKLILFCLAALFLSGCDMQMTSREASAVLEVMKPIYGKDQIYEHIYHLIKEN